VMVQGNATLPAVPPGGIYRAAASSRRGDARSWVGEAVQLLDPLVGALERYVLGACKLHADDTPVPVLPRAGPHPDRPVVAYGPR